MRPLLCLTAPLALAMPRRRLLLLLHVAVRRFKRPRASSTEPRLRRDPWRGEVGKPRVPDLSPMLCVRPAACVAWLQMCFSLPSLSLSAQV